MAEPKIRFPGFTGDWEQRKLGDVADSFEYGLNAAAKEFDGANKYIRITDIDDYEPPFCERHRCEMKRALSPGSFYLLYLDCRAGTLQNPKG